MRIALARALSVDDVNQLGRQTGQSERLRTITPHRLFRSTVAALAGGKVESLADLLREFNFQNDVTVADKAFYNRLARPGFPKLMHEMFVRLVEQSSVRMLAPEGGRPISTRGLAMCSSHIIDELAMTLLACVSIATVFREGCPISWPTHAGRTRLATAGLGGYGLASPPSEAVPKGSPMSAAYKPAQDPMPVT